MVCRRRKYIECVPTTLRSPMRVLLCNSPGIDLFCQDQCFNDNVKVGRPGSQASWYAWTNCFKIKCILTYTTGFTIFIISGICPRNQKKVNVLSETVSFCFLHLLGLSSILMLSVKFSVRCTDSLRKENFFGALGIFLTVYFKFFRLSFSKCMYKYQKKLQFAVSSW